MDLRDRFFGKGTPKLGDPPVANPRLTDPPSFQLLFAGPLELNADEMTGALRDYHQDLAQATAELLPMQRSESASSTGPSVIGLVGWERHVVKLIGYDSPLDAERVKACVQSAHYPVQLKEEAYRHPAHVILHYAGYEPDPLEQHVALAVVSAALARFGAMVVMNETALTSIPAMVFEPHEEDGGDTLRAMRNLPLPVIYTGFVLLEIDGEPGIWMRTRGAQAFKLPDLAFHADQAQQAGGVLDLFSNMLAYLRTSGKSFAPGDTMGIGTGHFFQFRARNTDEWFLESPGEILVIEPAAAGEVNS